MATRRLILLPLKIFGITIGALLGLVLLVLAALPFVLDSPLLGRTLQKMAAQYVDGNLEIGDVRLHVLSYPDLKLDASGLVLTYPHDRFSGLAPDADEGRGESADTLASVESLHLEADARAFLKRHEVKVPRAEIKGLRSFLHRYAEGADNWQVLLMPESSDTTSSSSFEIAGIKVDTLQVISPRVVFADVPDTLAATLDMARLGASALYVPGDSAYVQAFIDIDRLVACDLVGTLAASFSPYARAVRTDALVSACASMAGNLGGALPPVTVSLSVPESHISYSDLVQDALLAIEASGENTADGVMSVDIASLGFHMDGLDLDGEGGAQDLTGSDPLFSMRVGADASLSKLVSYLPRSFRDLSAEGDIDLDVSGSIRKSQMSVYGYARSSLKGRASADRIVVDWPSHEIEAYVLSPHVQLSTAQDVTGGSGRQATVTARMDSLNFDLGEALCAQGNSISLFAQNSADTINSEFAYHPFTGKLKADRVFVRGTDSLGLAMSGADNLFTLTRASSHGRGVPHLKLSSTFEGISAEGKGSRVAVRDVSLVADAQSRTRRSRDTSAVRQRRRHELSETVPDFLSEKDFRTADLDFRLDKSLSDMIVKWDPSVRFKVSRGTATFPSYPLDTRFSHLFGSFVKDTLTLDALSLRTGSSDVVADACVTGLKRMLTRGGTLGIDANLRSEVLDVNEILAAVAGEDSVAVDSDDVERELSYSLFIVPANVSARMTVDVDSLYYSTLLLEDSHAGVQMKERCLQLLDVSIQTDMGSVELNAFYSTETKADITAGFDAALRNVTAEKVIQLFPTVDEVLPLLKSFKGNLNCSAAATTQLDTNMNISIPTLNGMFKISGSDLVVEDMGSLRKLTKLLMFKDKDTGHIDDMSVYGIIDDNALEVFPFVMSVDRYTVALKGVQDFSTGFDYHASVIRSPLPFKIGIKIFGPDFDHWKYRLVRPLYKNTSLPVFTEQVDNLQLNLSTSIRDIFARGVDRAVQEARAAQNAITGRKRELDYGSGEDELLSADEQNQIEVMMISEEIDEETEEINREIEELLKNF